MPASPRKAVVIGAGFGGLAAALRLRALGMDVTVIDRCAVPGGRAAVFTRDGFFYDAGPTVITAPFLFDELFALFGEKRSDHIEFLPVKPWYRMVDAENRVFNYGGTVEEVVNEIKKFDASDVDGYRRMLTHSHRLYEEGFTRLGAVPFSNFTSMLKAFPALVRLRGDRSVWQFVCHYLKNDSLRRFFSIQPLLVGGNPFKTSSIYSLIHYLEIKDGVWFARGGTGQLVKALVDLAKRQGITFVSGTTVEEIEIENKQVRSVRTDQGESFKCDVVVSNGDPPEVYQKLIQPRHRKKWTNPRIDRLEYSMGLFVLYFGTDRPWPEVAHHTILFSQRYRELLEDIFGKDSLADDPSLYLHRPSATDPSMAPPGKDAFYVLAPVPNLKAKINWSVEGERYAKLIIDECEKRLMPGLSASVVSQFFVTPEYFRDQLLTKHGTGFSIAPTLTQSAWFRFHNDSEDIDGLYFVGAGTHPGAGLPGVVTSAKVVESLLKKKQV